ncbi:hypothetical protein I3842_08G068200 [Carya illinoinensis]|uniref:Uncharacterized protein n=1 Tax=Carya illinoinensis TaxID=32201 RepID=A0A922EC40_CARIL|nr:hypothetical protein I3842_08G068200 [Carya illinoinensis]
MGAATSYEQPWCLEGFMNGEMVSIAGLNKEYPWQQMMQTKVRLNKDDTIICDTSVAYSQGLQNQEQLIHYYQFMWKLKTKKTDHEDEEARSI